MLTQVYVQYRFIYINGKLHWKICYDKSSQWNGKHAGALAGAVRKDGRIVIRLDSKLYLASRLIFLYHHGYLPEEVDHRDRDVTNDLIENLLASNRQKNNSNTNAKGYTRLGPNKFWARIFTKGKQMNLGIFPTREKAREAYLTAQAEIMEENYG
jgi:hypothetical protein